MNDDELRDHLRTTLDPVDPARPDLVRLRRLARRRRRRLQATAGGLGLLLIAGAGVGIAEATSNGSGSSEVTVGSPPPASTVSVRCGGTGDPNVTVTAPVTIAVGQTLAFDGCTLWHNPSVSGGEVLQRTGSLSFRAEHVGTAQVAFLSIAPAACPLVAGASPPCAFVANRFDVAVTPGVGSGQAMPAPTATARSGRPGLVTMPCKGGRVTVPVGDQLRLTGCPVGVSSHVDDPSVLTVGTAPNTFTAKQAGTTNVELFVKPQCSPGMMCPQYVRDIGILVVTVTAD